MNIIITSEHRVGSRWLHYLLKDILSMRQSPEIDVSKIKEETPTIREYFETGRIVKFHHATPHDIIKDLEPHDYKIIGVVRNPRDRGVSLAFHNRYHENNPDAFVESTLDSDKEAVNYTISSNSYKDWNNNQLRLMIDGHSTHNYFENGPTNLKVPYIWTSYEWMLSDTKKEITTILNFLNINYNEEVVEDLVIAHSFKNKSGREPGEEDREDNWRRKGMMLDWINWFNPQMLKETRQNQNEYWTRLIRNS